MSDSLKKKPAPNRTPRVLAVLPDLSGYRNTVTEAVEIAETPRRAVPSRISGSRVPATRQTGRKAIITVSIFLAVLTLITWKIVTRTQALPKTSPLKGSYMTRFATPPQQATDELATFTNRP